MCVQVIACCVPSSGACHLQVTLGLLSHGLVWDDYDVPMAGWVRLGSEK